MSEQAACALVVGRSMVETSVTSDAGRQLSFSARSTSDAVGNRCWRRR